MKQITDINFKLQKIKVGLFHELNVIVNRPIARKVLHI